MSAAGGDATSGILGGVTPAQVREQMDRILASRRFRNSERLQRFLRFAVESALDGAAEQLKESILGREVFDRGPRYDPRTDSIVRVESQRLRKKLAEYYKTEGDADPVLISFRSGSYVPSFESAREEFPRAGSTRPAHPQLDARTVVVLPFVNLSPEPDQDYFCEGITEDTMRAICRVPGIKVIGRTSAYAVRTFTNAYDEIGARLGAGSVVEGSVRKAGNQLKVAAQMVDAKTGHIRWSESFDSVLGDVFAIQEEIAQTIARGLQVKLTSMRPGKLAGDAPDVEAYALYLRGRQAWNNMSLEGCRTAIGYYDRALSLSPAYASPYAGLADAYSYMALWSGIRPREVFPKAKQAALAALRINPELAHAYSSLAIATLMHDWNPSESMAFAKRATDLEPCYSFGQYSYGMCLIASGEPQEAFRCFERALQLNPLSVRAHRSMGWAYYLQRRYQDAENWLRAAVALSPGPTDARFLLAHVYLQQGRPQDALNEARQCQEDPPNPLALGVLGACLARTNQRDEAKQVLQNLLEMSAAGYVDPYAIGQVYLGLEDYNHALESVRRSLEERTPLAVLLSLDPVFDPLRSDPRFSDVFAHTLK